MTTTSTRTWTAFLLTCRGCNRLARVSQEAIDQWRRDDSIPATVTDKQIAEDFDFCLGCVNGEHGIGEYLVCQGVDGDDEPHGAANIRVYEYRSADMQGEGSTEWATHVWCDGCAADARHAGVVIKGDLPSMGVPDVAGVSDRAQRLVQWVADAGFECGEWSDDDDEDYGAIYASSLEAQSKLYAYIAELEGTKRKAATLALEAVRALFNAIVERDEPTTDGTFTGLTRGMGERDEPALSTAEWNRQLREGARDLAEVQARQAQDIATIEGAVADATGGATT